MASPALEGIFRSLRIYHYDRVRQDGMDALYRQHLSPGDLAFDIGSHVGDRVSSFRRVGARVVALEPQPLAFRALRLIHGRDKHVRLVQAACGVEAGRLRLHINTNNPTVSTASTAFLSAAEGAEGWDEQVWDQQFDVACVTLDELIAEYGEPQFVKIDVEGFEGDVLGGLTRPVRALSFEFTTIQRGVAFDCLARLTALGEYRFNVALGESQTLMFDALVSGNDMRDYLAELPHEANSGDVYAVL